MTSEILIIDDEAGIRNLIRGILEDEGYVASEAHNDVSAYEAIAAKKPDLIILDIWLQNSQDDGMGILEKVKAQYPFLPVLMISGHGNIETAVKAIKLGAYDFIEKPFKTDRLLLMIERALEAASLRKENESLRQRTGNTSSFVGHSDAINNLQTVLEKIAQTNSRVLISGERGTGKSIAARFIHDHSTRSGEPFKFLSCGMADAQKLRHALFGSENNGNIKEGLVEKAICGTILLDDIAALPLDIQGDLVKVLHEGKITRDGGSTPIQCDVRIIATTNKDLDQLIVNKEFREDLYYRLNVASVRVPSLSERLQDVPEYVAFFAQRYCDEHGLKPISFAECALISLQTYNWPGNIRQLRNVIEWSIIMYGSEQAEITADMLPKTLISIDQAALTGNAGSTATQGMNMSDFAALSLREARELFECEYLSSQIKRFGGNISKTAEFIGMERSALHRKLKQLGLTTTIQKTQDQNDLEQVNVA